MNPQVRVLLVALLVTSFVLTAGPVVSAPPPCCRPDPQPGGDDPRAVALLAASAAAPSRVSYTGTRVVSAWNRGEATTVLLEVQHVAGQGSLVTPRSGPVEPGTAAFVAAAGGPSGTEPAVSSLDLLTSTYDVRLAGTATVAGRATEVVEASRDGRLVARLWLDRASGLLLRRELFGTGGELVGESAFLEVDVHAPGFLAHLPPQVPPPVEQPVRLSARDRLERAGWHCPQRLGRLALVGIEALDGPQAMHLTYTDGLFRLSLFEQRGSLDEPATAGLRPIRVGAVTAWVSPGLPSYALWADDGLVYTAVSDAPTDVLREVVAATATEPPAPPGFWYRVGSGLWRMASWVAPLP